MCVPEFQNTSWNDERANVQNCKIRENVPESNTSKINDEFSLLILIGLIFITLAAVIVILISLLVIMKCICAKQTANESVEETNSREEDFEKICEQNTNKFNSESY